MYELGALWCAQATPDASRDTSRPEALVPVAEDATQQTHRQLYKKFHQTFVRWLGRRQWRLTDKKEQSEATWDGFVGADSFTRLALPNELELDAMPERALRDGG